MKKNIGIIIKRYFPKKAKLDVLDKRLGKIECVLKSGGVGLLTGSLIEYIIEPLRGVYYISSVEILNVPFELAKKDILFLHHILEIYYYFIPYDSCFDDCALNLFNLLKKIYCSQKYFNTLISKKIFLINFFNLIGIIPEKEYILNKKDINSCLLECLRMHPKCNRFKTINFLNKNGME